MRGAHLAGVAAITVTSVLWGTTGTAATFAPEAGPLAIGSAALGIGGLLQAAVAVKDGLPESAAVDIMTINTARHMGLEKRIGSLAARKDADLFITDGDVLDPRHHGLATFIDGFCVHAL